MMEPFPIPVDRPPRIIIAAVQIPFVAGGAESHIESLRRELARRDFEVDVVRLPLKWYPPRQILNDALAWRFLDLTHSYGLPIDLVIATRFPSYAVRHPRKVAWVLHQHRQAYDLLNTELTDFTDSVDDDEARGLLYDIDKRSLLECRKIFTNSRNVSRRMKKFLGIDGTPLYHPPPLSGRYFCRGYGDFVLSVGRIEMNKRVDLLIRALALTQHPLKAVIAGKGPQQAAMEKLAAELGVASRVTFLGYVTDEALLELYADCGAVFYSPLDEDYGYVTLEAFLSEKAVITSSDAGGVLEFVTHEKTGLVGDPSPEALARLLDRWHALEDKGRAMGTAGKQRVLDIRWDNVIAALTSVLNEDGHTEKTLG